MLREFVLTGDYAERARKWLTTPSDEFVTPKTAATVVLVRDGDTGVEVFMMRRQQSMAFAGGMYVFPGGGVDPRDFGDDVPWAGPDAETWAEHLRIDAEGARGFVCAAVRETFEECGVLLAGETPEEVLAAAHTDEWEADRHRLISREVAMSDLLRDRGLVLRSDLLRPWAHWTTPVNEPRRFDTRFLIAVLPEGQEARHVGGEAVESGWLRPKDVLDRFARGEILMLPPTIVTVEEVAAASDAASLWAQDRRLSEVMPVLHSRGDDMVMVAEIPEQP
jgi:8-oxo-dGTP pyrophosphatase MutT (NUDIX family)